MSRAQYAIIQLKNNNPMPLNALSTELYQKAYVQAEQTGTKVKLGEDGETGVPLDTVYKILEEMLYEEFKSINFLKNPDIYTQIYKAIVNWDPGKLSPEQFQAISITQILLMNTVLKRVCLEQGISVSDESENNGQTYTPDEKEHNSEAHNNSTKDDEDKESSNNTFNINFPKLAPSQQVDSLK